MTLPLSAEKWKWGPGPQWIAESKGYTLYIYIYIYIYIYSTYYVCRREGQGSRRDCFLRLQVCEFSYFSPHFLYTQIQWKPLIRVFFKCLLIVMISNNNKKMPQFKKNIHLWIIYFSINTHKNKFNLPFKVTCFPLMGWALMLLITPG